MITPTFIYWLTIIGILAALQTMGLLLAVIKDKRVKPWAWVPILSVVVILIKVALLSLSEVLFWTREGIEWVITKFDEIC